MKNREFNIEDYTERYIYQVSKHLDVASRKDIEDELRALISDMYEQKSQGDASSKEALQAVLNELGNPMELANKYRDKTRYLIGPEFFPAYTLILRIILLSVLVGMTVITALDLLSEPNQAWYEFLASWIINIIMGVGSAFTWVTIIFAVFEWRGVNLKELMKEIHPLDISELPPVPQKKLRIPVWEPISGLVFSVLLAILYILAPQLMGAFYFDEGLKTIPLFNLTVFRAVTPIFIATLLPDVAKYVWEIYEGRYTRRYSIFVLVNNVIHILVTVFLLAKPTLWNQEFISQIKSVYQLELDLPVILTWNQCITAFVAFLVLIFILDTATTLYKAFKYSDN